MNITNLDTFITVVIFGLYLIIKCAQIIINIKKNKNANKLQLVKEQVLLLVQEAETLFDNGIVKKEFVLESINKFLIQKNIKLDIKVIDNLIEEIINISKTINYQGEKDE